MIRTKFIRTFKDRLVVFPLVLCLFGSSCPLVAQSGLSISQMESRLKSEPRNLELIKKIANAYYKMDGMMYNVIFYADKGLAIDPSNKELFDLKVRGLMGDDECDKAITIINTKIRQNGSAEPMDLLRRGQCKYNLGNKDLALEDFEAAYSLDPNNTEIEFSLGYAKAMVSGDNYYTNKYIDAALKKIDEDGDRLFFNKRTLADIYYTKAIQLAKAEDKDGAVKYIEKALKLNPLDPDANIWNGRRYLFAHWYSTALDYFEKALSPQNRGYKRADIMGYIALCKYYISEYRKNESYSVSKDDAFTALKEAVKYGNKFGSVYLFLGVISYERGDIQTAADYFLDAIDNEYADSELRKEAVGESSFLSYIEQRYRSALNFMDDPDEE